MQPALGLDPELVRLTAASVYLVVFGFVFIESGLLVGFFLPGDTLLFAAGLLAADESSGVSLPVLLVGVVVAAVAGDAVGYAFGSRLGRPWLERRVRRGRLDSRHLVRADRFYRRYGWWAVVAARWMPWVRTFTPILAGTSHMAYRTFLSANVTGALGWGVGLLTLGYLAADLPVLRQVSYGVAAAFVVGSLVAGTVAWARRR